MNIYSQQMMPLQQRVVSNRLKDHATANRPKVQYQNNVSFGISLKKTPGKVAHPSNIKAMILGIIALLGAVTTSCTRPELEPVYSIEVPIKDPDPFHDISMLVTNTNNETVSITLTPDDSAQWYAEMMQLLLPDYLDKSNKDFFINALENNHNIKDGIHHYLLTSQYLLELSTGSEKEKVNKDMLDGSKTLVQIALAYNNLNKDEKAEIDAKFAEDIKTNYLNLWNRTISLEKFNSLLVSIKEAVQSYLPNANSVKQ